MPPISTESYPPDPRPPIVDPVLNAQLRGPRYGSGPPVEMGLRFWYGSGSTIYSTDASQYDPSYGNPTSVLAYTGKSMASAEFALRTADPDSRLFFKGFIGGGWINGGALDDEDYTTGQVKYFDTYSKIKSGDAFYMSADVGRLFVLDRSRNSIFLFNPFAGVHYWDEMEHAYGIRCNDDDVDGSYCGGPPGTVLTPFSVNTISNETNWLSFRLGAEMQARFYDKFLLNMEAAYVPLAYFDNESSHHLRQDLGPVPNVRHYGQGAGYQLEASLYYDILPNTSVGGGVRYWHLAGGGTAELVQSQLQFTLNDLASERYGIFGELNYKFGGY